MLRRIKVLLNNLLCIPIRLGSRISPFCILQNAKVDKTAAICGGTRFYRSSLGRYSYIGMNSWVNDTDIGNFSSIAGHCYIGGTSHPLNWVSTSPVFHKWDNILRKHFSKHEFDIFARTTIGNDVWIGSNVMIKAGITIADGAVVGMGAVVTKDIGPYEIWVGNPARCIKKRFDESTIAYLLGLKWWGKNDTEIETMARYFNNISEFMKS